MLFEGTPGDFGVFGVDMLMIGDRGCDNISFQYPDYCEL